MCSNFCKAFVFSWNKSDQFQVTKVTQSNKSLFEKVTNIITILEIVTSYLISFSQPDHRTLLAYGCT